MVHNKVVNSGKLPCLTCKYQRRINLNTWENTLAYLERSNMKGKERVHNKVLHSGKLPVLLSNIIIGKIACLGHGTL